MAIQKINSDVMNDIILTIIKELKQSKETASLARIFQKMFNRNGSYYFVIPSIEKIIWLDDEFVKLDVEIKEILEDYGLSKRIYKRVKLFEADTGFGNISKLRNKIGFSIGQNINVDKFFHEIDIGAWIGNDIDDEELDIIEDKIRKVLNTFFNKLENSLKREFPVSQKLLRSSRIDKICQKISNVVYEQYGLKLVIKYAIRGCEKDAYGNYTLEFNLEFEIK